MATPVRIVGLGGSLRAESTSRSALQAALDGAAATGADVQLIGVRDLGLPLYTVAGAGRRGGARRPPVPGQRHLRLRRATAVCDRT